MRVTNVSRGVLLGDCIEIADTSAKRRTGLLKRESLNRGEGLWITPCEGVHTFCMKFPIDVVFLSKRHQVLKIRTMPRHRISVCLRAYSVLELPAGTADATGTQPGDVLEFNPGEVCQAFWQSAKLFGGCRGAAERSAICEISLSGCAV